MKFIDFLEVVSEIQDREKESDDDIIGSLIHILFKELEKLPELKNQLKIFQWFPEMNRAEFLITRTNKFEHRKVHDEKYMMNHKYKIEIIVEENEEEE